MVSSGRSGGSSGRSNAQSRGDPGPSKAGFVLSFPATPGNGQTHAQPKVQAASTEMCRYGVNQNYDRAA